MFERTLPIGSVVSLYGAEKRLMVLGYLKYLKGDDTSVYDYCGCTFPEGYLNSESTAVFNHQDIEHIYALGFQDELQFEFRNRLLQILEERDEAAQEKPEQE
ncbi:MAG: DUF4176 domain-containing protein [Lachnospiraceae bacterium]|nr:DUF4176 domain-containing protein [Lachnospiraceae bacterium]